MNTIPYSSINFGAKFIKNASVQKLDNNNQPRSEQVSLVELLPSEKSDIKAFEKTVQKWGKDALFGQFILDDMEDIKRKKMSGEVYKIYALSTQTDNFEKLESGEILGAGVFEETDNCSKIRFLQVNPKQKYNVSQKNYANVGKSLVNFFKEICKNSQLFVQSYFSATYFYEKLGFELIEPSELIYCWQKILKK